MRIAIAVLAALLLTACSSAAPDIEVATAHDMGAVVKGEPAVAELTVRNLGNGPLTVSSVSTSCGCTTATLTPMVIPAGGQADLRVEYDSAVHEADIGPIERFVFISSDDPDEDDVRIRFTVTVEAESA